MCGICGVVSFDPGSGVDSTVLKSMCSVLRHRGPDDEGYYHDEWAGLGVCRLSVIDLVTGQQPMTNEDKSLWLVFNGEIYNYQALRLRLEERGHVFSSRSDSEVILHAYEEYGARCVDEFNGMFVFAVWDKIQRRLLIVRDRLGIKPLYFRTEGKQLIFGSELKALLVHPRLLGEVDPIALDQFLTLEYIPAPRTILKGVQKLPAGHRLVFEHGIVTIDQYWDIPLRKVPTERNACIEQLTSLIEDSVRLRLASDVPLGSLLSGGIDSSTVTAFMSYASGAPVRTFSIGFDEKSYNELPFARAVAAHFSTQHREEILKPNICDLAERLLRHLDEPLADFSIFPTYLVSEMARRSVKVVLSGDGGDELFGGYDTYLAQRIDSLYRWLPVRFRHQILPALMDTVPPRATKKGLINMSKRFVEGGALPASLQHARWMIFLKDGEKERLYQPEFYATLNSAAPAAVIEKYLQEERWGNALAQQQYADIKTYLSDNILTKLDRMSMAASLEARVPLLDHRIVEFAVNLPPGLKIRGMQRKVILRKAMAGRLPARIVNKSKQGFSIPLKHWLGGPLRPLMRDLLAEDCVRRRGYFQPECVSRWVCEHMEGRANHSHRLWALMVFEMWQRSVLRSVTG